MKKTIKNLIVLIVITGTSIIAPKLMAETPLAAFESAGTITYIDLGSGRLDINEKRYSVNEETLIRSLQSSDSMSIYKYPLEKGASVSYISSVVKRGEIATIKEIMIMNKGR